MNDNTIRIDPKLAQKHGIKLDKHGWPTEESLKAFHSKHSSAVKVVVVEDEPIEAEVVEN